MVSATASGPTHGARRGRALRWVPVWQRNLLVWRKLAVPSVLSNFGEPVLYLLALGFGLGAFVGRIEGMPYIVFIASGILCSSALISASFEAMYSGYSRMATQRTWDAMTTAPLDWRDVVLGEVVWAATKALISSTAILIVASALGAVYSWTAIFALPIVFLSALCFASMAMVMTAIAKAYDNFLYYQTLCITPMFMLGGVFFPIEQMPGPIQKLAAIMPLTHTVAIVRPLVTGLPVNNLGGHVLVLAAYGVSAWWLATRLLERRLSA